MPPELSTELGGLRLTSPIVCGSGEHTMTYDGIVAALDAGAAAVVAKSANESPDARRQLASAEYVLLDEDWAPLPFGPAPRSASLLNRSGLVGTPFPEWLETLARADAYARHREAYVVASLIPGDADELPGLASAVEHASLRWLELNLSAPHAGEAALGAIGRADSVAAARELTASVRAATGLHLTVKLSGDGADAVALAVAATQGRLVLVVVAGGLVLNAAYSLPPIRLSDRGGLASIVLPSAYVVVPYLVGALTVSPGIERRDLLLLPGLYVGFVGRILLKDFRDVAGDALFGKWTFLLRHGRAATCQVSAVCWIVGAAAVVLALSDNVLVALSAAGFVACALHGLGRLAAGGDPIADQVIIGAIAQAGRGLCVSVLAHLTMLGEGWAVGPHAAVLGLLGVVFVAEYATTLAQRAPQWALRPS